MPRRNKSHHQRRARARLTKLDARAAASEPKRLPLWLELDQAARSLVRRGLASSVILGPIRPGREEAIR